MHSGSRALQPFHAIEWRAEEPALHAVQGVIQTLGSLRWMHEPRPPSEAQFRARFSRLARFRTHTTSFTPLCLRLLYGVGHAHRGATFVGIGSGDGLAVAALAAGALDRAGAAPLCAVGVDINPLAVATARRNAKLLAAGGSLGFRSADGLEYLAACLDPIDVLLLDADCPVRGKAIYVDLLRAALPRLAPGAVVLAHDACTPQFNADLRQYARAVRAAGLQGPLDVPVGAGWSFAVRAPSHTCTPI